MQHALMPPSGTEPLAPGPARGPADELAALRAENEQLARAVTQSRDLNVVVGILMERFRIDRQAAFETLRGQARARRVRLEDFAGTLLAAEEQLQRISARLAAQAPGRPAKGD